MLLAVFPSCWYNPNVVGRMTREAADEQAKASLRRGRVRWGRHFVRELENETLSIQDVFALIRSGNVLAEPEPDIRTGDWKYRLEGCEPGGNRSAIVFCFRQIDAVFLITIFSLERK
jgi:hypothetical protein